MDTIELSNLNRQFLFRMNDVGKSKAIVAAEVVKSKVASCNITPYFNKIQDFDDEFYTKFDLIICGLDSIEARRWINSTLVNLAENSKIIPMIDGGTEGFHGSVKVIIPTFTACFECYMDIVPERITYPLCTLASTPRLPEHCIEWAHQLEWPKVHPDTEFDADNMDHVDLMYGLALERAEKFGIEGVTKSKTLGVVKNIIPAIASTNAIISAACCNEVMKFITDVNPVMNDMMFYNGEMGVVAVNNLYKKKANCPVCGTLQRELELNGPTYTIESMALEIKDKLGLENPGLSTNGVDFYNFKFGPNKSSNALIRDVLPFKANELVVDVVDPTLSNTMKLKITIKE